MSDILNFSAENGCVVVFLVVLLEQTGLPIPAAPCLLAAGALCATGESSVGFLLAITVLACLLADVAWFYIGRRGGNQVLHFICRFVPSGNFSPTQLGRTFERYGLSVVVVAKFIPGLSVVVPPLAGSLGIGLGQFLLYDALGSVLYAAFYLLLGALFRERVQAALDMLGELGLCSLLVVVALAAVWIAFRHGPNRKSLSTWNKTANPN